MTISDTAKELQKWLNDWASNPTNGGGGALIVPSLDEQWIKQAMSAQKMRVLIQFVSDTPRGSYQMSDQLRRVDRLWNVAVIRARVMTATRERNLAESIGNNESLLKMVEECRDGIRSMAYISDEPITFMGTKPLATRNNISDGYVIAFTTVADLPLITTNPNL